MFDTGTKTVPWELLWSQMEHLPCYGRTAGRIHTTAVAHAKLVQLTVLPEPKQLVTNGLLFRNVIQSTLWSYCTISCRCATSIVVYVWPKINFYGTGWHGHWVVKRRIASVYNVASNVFDCYNAFTLTETDKMGILLNGIPPHSSCNPFLIGLGLCQY